MAHSGGTIRKVCGTRGQLSRRRKLSFSPFAVSFRGISIGGMEVPFFYVCFLKNIEEDES